LLLEQTTLSVVTFPPRFRNQVHSKFAHNHCPVHDQRAEEEQAADPAPTMEPAPEADTDKQEQERKSVTHDQIVIDLDVLEVRWQLEIWHQF
jgi:hypothetical protein